MSNPLMKDIDSTLQMLNILNSRSERVNRNSLSSNEIFLSMADISYTAPVHGFAYLSISRKNPFKTFLGETSKRLEKQLREDNNGANATRSCNNIWEIYSFVYEFPDSSSRLSFFNYLRERCHSNVCPGKWNAPWLLKKRMKIHSKRGSLNLKFIKCCYPNKEDIRNFSIASGIELLEH